MLRRRYLNLGVGELVAAATFAVVAAVRIAPRLDEPASVALWAALTPLLVILAQAGVYWLSARTWAANAPMPATIAAAYRGAVRGSRGAGVDPAVWIGTGRMLDTRTDSWTRAESATRAEQFASGLRLHRTNGFSASGVA